MTWKFGLLALAIFAAVGCTTVERGTQRARVAVVSTGERVGSGVNTVAVKTRSWWSRMFDRDGSSSQGARRKAASAESSSSNGRYETVAPRYVGSENSR